MAQYFDHAYHIALKSPVVHQLGAVLVHRSKIIAVGFNRYVFAEHARWRTGRRKSSIHAEVQCLGKRSEEVW
jgi:deoxycytidylate deaminase